jgi:CRP/FNR family transcriptional regulator, cyclic AMP receptor protein
MKAVSQASQSALAASVVKSCSWFSDCSPESRHSIVAEGKLRVLERGSFLSRRGEPVHELAVVIDGALEVSATAASGKRRVLRYLEPGQIMNLIPFIDEQGAIHDAAAHTDLLLLLIGRPLFAQITGAEPELVHRLLRLLCLRSRMLYNEYEDISFLTLRQRCARALLHLVEPYGRFDKEGVTLSLKLSQEELADMVGCSRPMINRELKQLEQDGAITMTYSHYVIRDPGVLASIASGA